MLPLWARVGIRRALLCDVTRVRGQDCKNEVETDMEVEPERQNAESMKIIRRSR